MNAVDVTPDLMGSGGSPEIQDSLFRDGFGLLEAKSDLGADEGIAAMGKNIGPADRVVRIVVGLGLAVLVYLGVLPSVGGIVAGIIAAYLIITGLLARCALYKVADIDTSIQEQPYSTTDDRAGF